MTLGCVRGLCLKRRGGFSARHSGGQIPTFVLPRCKNSTSCNQDARPITSTSLPARGGCRGDAVECIVGEAGRGSHPDYTGSLTVGHEYPSLARTLIWSAARRGGPHSKPQIAQRETLGATRGESRFFVAALLRMTAAKRLLVDVRLCILGVLRLLQLLFGLLVRRVFRTLFSRAARVDTWQLTDDIGDSLV